MKKVMLVEDEDFILQGIKNIIDWEALGMTIVHMAQDGLEALACWEKEEVDIVVSDISMPRMGGLALMERLSEKSKRVRFIILTGYDEFEYARAAIHLEVENYILKPINEELLESSLQSAAAKLEEREHANMEQIDVKTDLMRFLNGKMDSGEQELYLKETGLSANSPYSYAAVMKLKMDSLGDSKLTDVMRWLWQSVTGQEIRIYHLPPDSILLTLSFISEKGREVRQYLMEVLNQIEDRFGIQIFISISSPFVEFAEMPRAYREALQLQKNLVIDGYGSCVDGEFIYNRKPMDISVDADRLQRLIIQKDKAGALTFLEDLFANHVNRELEADALLQMCLRIAGIIHGIREEYKLTGRGGKHHLYHLIEEMNHAEDIAEVKAVFSGEIMDIIDSMHTEESHYTPVIKQILAEVRENYREDMNLKTLAYKYHMNTSYLGQIFQKEVGCSFAQYLSNTKNRKAKDLILSTNMRINDIAKEVGYPDTSYFYRKFKQCYGVSPASLREMKKY